jgi:hypothetical protein
MKRMEGKLIDAYTLLFGTHNRRGGMAVLQQLDTAAVRRAYRVLAVASHPDAVARRGGSRHAGVDGRLFIEVSRAYELLMGYLVNRPKHHGPAQPSTRTAEKRGHGAEERRPGGEKRKPGEQKRAGEQKSGAGRKTADQRAGEKRAGHDSRTTGEKRTAGDRRPGGSSRSTPLYYRGPVPHRHLRLAEFLYYTGRISWQSLIGSIVWQRAAQPRFGELAKEMRRISGPDLARILSSRVRGEQTGQTAQRLHILTEAEVERILKLQRARRKPIGRYFVEKDGLTNTKLGEILWEMHRHNARHGK